MNKVFEYSTLGVPPVSYDLSETRQLLGAAGQYAGDATPEGLARAALALIENDTLRSERSRAVKALADEKFDWKRERAKYLAAYERLAPPDSAIVLQERSKKSSRRGRGPAVRS